MSFSKADHCIRGPFIIQHFLISPFNERICIGPFWPPATVQSLFIIVSLSSVGIIDFVVVIINLTILLLTFELVDFSTMDLVIDGLRNSPDDVSDASIGVILLFQNSNLN